MKNMLSYRSPDIQHKEKTWMRWGSHNCHQLDQSVREVSLCGTRENLDVDLDLDNIFFISRVEKNVIEQESIPVGNVPPASQFRRGRVCPTPPTGCRPPSFPTDADTPPLGCSPPGCRPPSPLDADPHPLDADTLPRVDFPACITGHMTIREGVCIRGEGGLQPGRVASRGRRSASRRGVCIQRVLWTEGKTDVCESITLPKLRLRAVTLSLNTLNKHKREKSFLWHADFAVHFSQIEQNKMLA